MKYAVIGSGKIGTALARVFARKNIDFAIANSRGPANAALCSFQVTTKLLVTKLRN